MENSKTHNVRVNVNVSSNKKDFQDKVSFLKPESLLLTRNINNVNNVSKNEKDVDFKVKMIMRKLNADNSSRLFICKAVWNLKEDILESNLKQALKGNDPKRYFSWLCKRCM